MKSRVTALILTFFLGGIGIHKFYLGQSVQGIFYFLFCWTFIPSILALFQFIGLLLMSDHSFNLKYNNGF
ncbi:TM2 domain-containing protein [Flavobacterium chungangensis]|uniref:TM2 domain-containing protein n=1 Tax=Flavobacterium chungangensis TaxID=2708132 RepID=A0ABV8ZEM3_9FLAO